MLSEAKDPCKLWLNEAASGFLHKSLWLSGWHKILRPLRSLRMTAVISQ